MTSTPFYQDATSTIYHGDCREILPTLCADTIISDPPYGINFTGKRRRTDPEHESPYKGYDDSEQNFYATVPAVVSISERIARTAGFFCPVRHIWSMPRPVDAGGIWSDSCQGLSPFGFTSVHVVLYYGKDPKRIGRIGGSWPTGFRAHKPDDVCSRHPCAKPLSWMRWLVGRLSNHRETILDPFMGSGTTLVAAKLEGRRAVGIEINEDYCRIAVERLRQNMLFGIDAPSIQPAH